MNALFWTRGLFAALFLLVTYLTVTPNPEDAETGFALMRWIADLLFHDVGFADKVAHFSAYGVLAASAALARIKIAGRSSYLIAGLAAYGAVLEVVQGLGGVRSPELADAVANALGVLAGYPATRAVMRIAGPVRS